MKSQNLLLLLFSAILIAITFFACNNSGKGWYGEEFEISNPISVDELAQKLGENESVPVQVKGMITGVCRSEGCWITMQTGDEKTIYINTRDKSFSLPEGVQGKTATVKGDVFSIEKQIHDAMEEGWEKEDLDWIENISIEADGIFVE